MISLSTGLYIHSPPPSCPPPPYTTTHSTGHPSLFTFTPPVHLPPILSPTQLDTPLSSHSHLLSTSPLYYHPLNWTLLSVHIHTCCPPPPYTITHSAGHSTLPTFLPYCPPPPYTTTHSAGHPLPFPTFLLYCPPPPYTTIYSAGHPAVLPLYSPHVAPECRQPPVTATEQENERKFKIITVRAVDCAPICPLGLQPAPEGNKCRARGARKGSAVAMCNVKCAPLPLSPQDPCSSHPTVQAKE
jgi:hypothetical protein